jgi:tRNA(Ile)-lysidine synthase
MVIEVWLTIQMVSAEHVTFGMATHGELFDCSNGRSAMARNRVPLLVRKVERWLRRQEIGDGGIVVAVSGGPDSVALLRALLAARPPRSGNTMVVAHLNHRLRGAESEADAAFVRELHDQLARGHPALALRCEALDVAESARAEHANLEAVARRVRYDWLADRARETGAQWIATGHTADDQAETVLHRLLRGTGLQGLRGIAARRTLSSGLEVVRPMLSVTRAEVMEYLENEQQAYRVDSTNADLRFTRNRIRHQLLPHLARRYNPEIVTALCRLAAQADEAYRRVGALAHSLLAETELPRAGGLLIFDRQRLADAPRSLVCEMLRLVWARENWPTGRMSFTAWERIGDTAQGRAPAVDLPGGVRIRCKERVVQLGLS